MERWQAEINRQRLGVVEAKDEDDANTLPLRNSGSRLQNGTKLW